MQFDASFGIIPDSPTAIQKAYVDAFLPTFSDANSVDSPAYVIATINSQFDSQIQQALQVLWNSLNPNTSNGLGLDILAASILNLTRKPLIPSSVSVTFTVNLAPGGGVPTVTSITIPVGWSATASTLNPSPTYATTQTYTYTANGTYSVILYSQNIVTAVAASQLNTFNNLGGYISAFSNPNAANLGKPEETDAQFLARRKYYLNVAGQTYYGIEKAVQGLNIAALRSIFVAETIVDGTGGAVGNRGVTIYLEYPTNGAGGTFDLNDLNIKSIASTVYDFHAYGTNTYATAGGSGATTVPVNTPYGSYLSSVILNPMQLQRVGVTLRFVYNVNSFDAGFDGQIFPLNTLSSLRANVLKIVNDYFRSKTLPTDLIYTISELTEIIRRSFFGVVCLEPFTFTTYSPTLNGLTFLKRPIGYTFNLADADFTFTAVDKDTL